MSDPAERIGDESSCSSCTYWLQLEGAEQGSCRRYAAQPIAHVGDASDLRVSWPTTEPTDWCGEYGAR